MRHMINIFNLLVSTCAFIIIGILLFPMALVIIPIFCFLDAGVNGFDNGGDKLWINYFLGNQHEDFHPQY